MSLWQSQPSKFMHASFDGATPLCGLRAQLATDDEMPDDLSEYVRCKTCAALHEHFMRNRRRTLANGGRRSKPND